MGSCSVSSSQALILASTTVISFLSGAFADQEMAMSCALAAQQFIDFTDPSCADLVEMDNLDDTASMIALLCDNSCYHGFLKGFAAMALMDCPPDITWCDRHGNTCETNEVCLSEMDHKCHVPCSAGNCGFGSTCVDDFCWDNPEEHGKEARMDGFMEAPVFLGATCTKDGGGDSCMDSITSAFEGASSIADFCSGMDAAGCCLPTFLSIMMDPDEGGRFEATCPGLDLAADARCDIGSEGIAAIPGVDFCYHCIGSSAPYSDRCLTAAQSFFQGSSCDAGSHCDACTTTTAPGCSAAVTALLPKCGNAADGVAHGDSSDDDDVFEVNKSDGEVQAGVCAHCTPDAFDMTACVPYAKSWGERADRFFDYYFICGSAERNGLVVEEDQACIDAVQLHYTEIWASMCGATSSEKDEGFLIIIILLVVVVVVAGLVYQKKKKNSKVGESAANLKSVTPGGAVVVP